jgi:homoserine dehydrogenase
MERKSIGIGLIGLGVVAGEVARVLTETRTVLSERVGCPVELRKIKVLERDLSRPQVERLGAGLFTTDEDAFFNEPGIDIVIEAIGGEHPAFDYQARALTAGKHVVTSNKEVIAKHGAELRVLAREHGVSLRYEASSGGGIPLIAPLRRDLVANQITGIFAIINGTTNYILTSMAKEGVEFAAALKRAQELGYAEADPANDIEGTDAAYKIAIMASLAFRTVVEPEAVYHEGISRLDTRDFKYARELGYVIKLLAIAKLDNSAIEVRVHPVFIPEDSFLAGVNGVYNAVLVDGDLVGQVLFQGEGAGPRPTASAVVADAMAAAQDVLLGAGSTVAWQADSGRAVIPMDEVITRYYLRLSVTDRHGVLAQIARVLGDYLISISSVIQKETDSVNQTAEIVIMTHPAREAAVQAAVTELHDLEVVVEVNNFIRVEE